MTTERISNHAAQAFPPTRWSIVLAATHRSSPHSTAALESLCQAYWYPIYAYARRCGQSPHDAEDLTQEFFCRLLEKRWLDSASPNKGKLRSFLIVALKSFMAKEWRRETARRRGGGQRLVQLDTALAESCGATDRTSLTAEETFDQQWALTVLNLVLNRLRAEFVAAGRSQDFEVLKSCLMAERGAIDYAGMSAALGANEGAARVAVHRLRKRFREVYREEISQTLAEGSDLNEELRTLAAALARR